MHAVICRSILTSRGRSTARAKRHFSKVSKAVLISAAPHSRTANRDISTTAVRAHLETPQDITLTSCAREQPAAIYPCIHVLSRTHSLSLSLHTYRAQHTRTVGQTPAAPLVSPPPQSRKKK